MEDVLTNLSDGSIYSVLDIKSSYLSMALSKESKHVTAFVTHRGLFEFNFVPFGINVGSFALSEVMTDMLYELNKEGVVCYFDDVLIVSRTISEHKRTLERVLNIFEKRGVTLSVLKCQLFKTKISYLGVMIEKGNMCIDPKRIESILGIPAPRNRRGLYRLLGMLQFISKWIPNYQEVVSPLTRLRSAKVSFVWDEHCQFALNSIKQLICEHSVLKIPDVNKPFVVYSDSSRWSLAGFVGQKDEEGLVRPVSFFSRKLRELDMTKPIFYLELLAVVELLERHRIYLQQKFELWIDNRSLVWCLACPKRMAKYGNLIHRLMAFEFEVKFLPSFKNVTADFLSRMYNRFEYDIDGTCLGQKEESNNLMCINVWNLPWLRVSIKDHQLQDPILSGIINRLLGKEEIKDYVLVNGVLCKRTKARVNPVKICIPKSLSQNLIEYYHLYELAGHVGYLKTLKKISARYTWDGMAVQISDYVTSCVPCQLAKRKNEVRQGLLESKVDAIVNGHWYVDTLGKLPRTSEGFSFALIVVDSCSKVVRLEPLKCLSSKVIVDKLYEIMCRRGFPYLISCDNASIFTSGVFKEFLFCHGIRCARISPHHAAANLSERYIGTLKQALKIYCDGDQLSWKQHLLNIEFSINGSVNAETKYTPFELNYRYNVNDPLDVLWELDLVRESNQDTELLAKAFANIQKSWVRRKRVYDRGRIATGYQVGDKVLVKKYVKSSLIHKYNKSLEYSFDGPFEIIQELTANSFLVRRVNNSQDVRKVHVTDIKRFRERRVV
jgi:hypothetical protein